MNGKKNVSVLSNGKDYNYFKITKTIGYEYINGIKKPIKKQFYGSSKQNAEKKYKCFIENINKHQDYSDLNLGYLIKYYVKNILCINSNYSPGTINLYINSYKKYIKNSTLENILAKKISIEDLQIFYNNLQITKSSQNQNIN